MWLCHYVGDAALGVPFDKLLFSLRVVEAPTPTL